MSCSRLSRAGLVLEVRAGVVLSLASPGRAALFSRRLDLFGVLLSDVGDCSDLFVDADRDLLKFKVDCDCERGLLGRACGSVVGVLCVGALKVKGVADVFSCVLGVEVCCVSTWVVAEEFPRVSASDCAVAAVSVECGCSSRPAGVSEKLGHWGSPRLCPGFPQLRQMTSLSHVEEV